MNTTTTSLTALLIAALGAIVAREFDRRDAIALLDHRAANQIEEIEHLKEQAAKLRADAAEADVTRRAIAERFAALETEHAAATAALAAAEKALAEKAATNQPAPATAAPAPVPGTLPNPAAEAEKKRRIEAIDARLAANQKTLADWTAYRAKVEAATGDFSELNKLTGKGVRTSDADRKKFAEQKAAEIARANAEIARAQREIADLTAQRAALTMP